MRTAVTESQVIMCMNAHKVMSSGCSEAGKRMFTNDEWSALNRRGRRDLSNIGAMSAACYPPAMGAKAKITQPTTVLDAEIDRHLAANHDEIAAALAIGREEIARGEAVPLEPLDELLAGYRRRGEAGE